MYIFVILYLMVLGAAAYWFVSRFILNKEVKEKPHIPSKSSILSVEEFKRLSDFIKVAKVEEIKIGDIAMKIGSSDESFNVGIPR